MQCCGQLYVGKQQKVTLSASMIPFPQLSLLLPLSVAIAGRLPSRMPCPLNGFHFFSDTLITLVGCVFDVGLQSPSVAGGVSFSDFINIVGLLVHLMGVAFIITMAFTTPESFVLSRLRLSELLERMQKLGINMNFIFLQFQGLFLINTGEADHVDICPINFSLAQLQHGLNWDGISYELIHGLHGFQYWYRSCPPLTHPHVVKFLKACDYYFNVRLIGQNAAGRSNMNGWEVGVWNVVTNYFVWAIAPLASYLLNVPQRCM